MFLLKQMQERERTGDKLNEKLTQIEIQCKNLIIKNNDLQSNLFEKEQALEEWRSKYYENERKGILVDELQNRIKLLNEELHKYEILLEDRGQDLENMKKLSEDLELMRAKLSAANDAKQSLLDENFRKDESIKNLQEKLAIAEGKLNILNNLKNEWDRTAADGKTNDQIRYSLELKLVEAKREIEGLRMAKDDLQAKMGNQSDIESKLQSLLSDKDRLQELLTEKFKENEALRTKLTEAELKGMMLIELEKKNMIMKSEIEDLQNQNEGLNKEVRNLKTRIDEMRDKDRSNMNINEKVAELVVSFRLQRTKMACSIRSSSSSRRRETLSCLKSSRSRPENLTALTLLSSIRSKKESQSSKLT